MLIDFNFTETSFWLNAQNFFIYFVLLLYTIAVYNTVYKKQYLIKITGDKKIYYRNNSKNISLIIFLGIFLVSLTYYIASDFFGYQKIIRDYNFNFPDMNYGEEVYVYIASFVDKNYLLFRCIVWGGALLGIAFTYYRLSSNPNLCLIFLFWGFINTFSYARASLAMSIFFLGFSFVCKPIENFKALSFLVGGLVMISSCLFHYSLMIALIIAVFSLNSFLTISKKNIWIILVFIGIFVMFFLNTVFSDFISRNFNGSEYLDEKVQGYAQKEVLFGNWKGILQAYIEFAKYYISFILISRVVLFSKKRNVIIGTYLYKLYKLCFGIFIVATVFYFLDLDNKVFFYRVLYMSFIPLTILLSELYNTKCIPRKSINYLIAFFLFHEFWLYGFSLYSRY